MNNFWEWMKEKEYGECEIIGSRKRFRVFYSREASAFRTSIEATRQMLIGYMMEYLREKEGKIILSVGGRASIEIVYDYYVRDIEKVEEIIF